MMSSIAQYKVISGKYKPRQVEFHPHSHQLLFGTVKGNICTVNLQDKDKESMGKDSDSFHLESRIEYLGNYGYSPVDAILGLCWLKANPFRFVSGSGAGRVICGDIRLTSSTSCSDGDETFSHVKEYPLFHELTSVHTNCTSELLLLSGYDQRARVLDLETGSTLMEYADIHAKAINISRFSNHSPSILATSSFDGTVKAWDMRQNKKMPIYTIATDSGYVVMINFSHDDQFVLVSGHDNEITQYFALDGTNHTSFDVPRTGKLEHNYTRAYYSASGSHIFSGACEESAVSLLCSATGRLLTRFELYPNRKHPSLYVQSLRGSPLLDNRLCVLTSYKDVRSRELVLVDLPHVKSWNDLFECSPSVMQSVNASNDEITAMQIATTETQSNGSEPVVDAVMSDEGNEETIESRAAFNANRGHDSHQLGSIYPSADLYNSLGTMRCRARQLNTLSSISVILCSDGCSVSNDSSSIHVALVDADVTEIAPGIDAIICFEGTGILQCQSRHRVAIEAFKSDSASSMGFTVEFEESVQQPSQASSYSFVHSVVLQARCDVLRSLVVTAFSRFDLVSPRLMDCLVRAELGHVKIIPVIDLSQILSSQPIRINRSDSLWLQHQPSSQSLAAWANECNACDLSWTEFILDYLYVDTPMHCKRTVSNFWGTRELFEHKLANNDSDAVGACAVGRPTSGSPEFQTIESSAALNSCSSNCTVTDSGNGNVTFSCRYFSVDIFSCRMLCLRWINHTLAMQKRHSLDEEILFHNQIPLTDNILEDELFWRISPASLCLIQVFRMLYAIATVLNLQTLLIALDMLMARCLYNHTAMPVLGVGEEFDRSAVVTGVHQYLATHADAVDFISYNGYWEVMLARHEMIRDRIKLASTDSVLTSTSSLSPVSSDLPFVYSAAVTGNMPRAVWEKIRMLQIKNLHFVPETSIVRLQSMVTNSKWLRSWQPGYSPISLPEPYPSLSPDGYASEEEEDVEVKRLYHQYMNRCESSSSSSAVGCSGISRHGSIDTEIDTESVGPPQSRSCGGNDLEVGAIRRAYLPKFLSHSCNQVLGTSMLIIGGGFRHAGSTRYDPHGNTILHLYNTVTGTWTRQVTLGTPGHMPEMILGHCTVELTKGGNSRYVVVIGGLRPIHTDSDPRVTPDYVHVVDLQTMTWFKHSFPLPTNTYNSGFETRSSFPFQFRCRFTAVAMHSAHENCWTPVRDRPSDCMKYLPNYRAFQNNFELGGLGSEQQASSGGFRVNVSDISTEIIIFGGYCTQRRSFVNDVSIITVRNLYSDGVRNLCDEFINLQWNIYKPVISGSIPAPRFAHAAAMLESCDPISSNPNGTTPVRRMFIVGGIGQGANFLDIHCLRIDDMHHMHWETEIRSSGGHRDLRHGHTLSEIELSREDAQGCISTSGLVLIGGLNTRGHIMNDVWLMRLIGANQSGITISWTMIKTEGGIGQVPTGSRHQAISVQGRIFVFGGSDESEVMTDEAQSRELEPIVYSLDTRSSSRRGWSWGVGVLGEVITDRDLEGCLESDDSETKLRQLAVTRQILPTQWKCFKLWHRELRTRRQDSRIVRFNKFQNRAIDELFNFHPYQGVIDPHCDGIIDASTSTLPRDMYSLLVNCQDYSGALDSSLAHNSTLYRPDVTIHVCSSDGHDNRAMMEEHTFFAHSSIIRSRCDVLHAMLSADMQEAATQTIHISDCRPRVFFSLLCFVYTDILNVDNEDIMELLVLALQYGLVRLVRLCEGQLMQHASAEVALGMLEFSLWTERRTLRTSALSYLLRNGGLPSFSGSIDSSTDLVASPNHEDLAQVRSIDSTQSNAADSAASENQSEPHSEDATNRVGTWYRLLMERIQQIVHNTPSLLDDPDDDSASGSNDSDDEEPPERESAVRPNYNRKIRRMMMAAASLEAISPNSQSPLLPEIASSAKNNSLDKGRKRTLLQPSINVQGTVQERFLSRLASLPTSTEQWLSHDCEVSSSATEESEDDSSSTRATLEVLREEALRQRHLYFKCFGSHNIHSAEDNELTNPTESSLQPWAAVRSK